MIRHNIIYVVRDPTTHTSLSLSTVFFLPIACSLNGISRTSLLPLSYNNVLPHSSYFFRSALDCKIPSGAVSIHQSTADLALLVDSLHNRELSNEPSIQFIRCAFAVLIKRLGNCSMGVKRNLCLHGSLKNYVWFVRSLNSIDRFYLHLYFLVHLDSFFMNFLCRLSSRNCFASLPL